MEILLLMWTLAFGPSQTAPAVAVEAKDLEAGRVSVCSQPSVNTGAASVIPFSPMRTAIIVYVVNGQDLPFVNPTTDASDTVVSQDFQDQLLSGLGILACPKLSAATIAVPAEDSITRRIAKCLESAVHSISRAGGLPMLIPAAVDMVQGQKFQDSFAAQLACLAIGVQDGKLEFQAAEFGVLQITLSAGTAKTHAIAIGATALPALTKSNAPVAAFNDFVRARFAMPFPWSRTTSTERTTAFGNPLLGGLFRTGKFFAKAGLTTDTARLRRSLPAFGTYAFDSSPLISG